MQKQWKLWQTLFSWGPKSLQMVIAVMKLRRLLLVRKVMTNLSLSYIGEGNGNPLQCSCLESPGDGGAWWAAIYGVAQSRTRLKWFSSSSSSRLVITFLPRSKCLVISWLQSPSAVILEPRKIKPATVSIVSPSICHEVMGPDAWSQLIYL